MSESKKFKFKMGAAAGAAGWYLFNECKDTMINSRAEGQLVRSINEQLVKGLSKKADVFIETPMEMSLDEVQFILKKADERFKHVISPVASGLDRLMECMEKVEEQAVDKKVMDRKNKRSKTPKKE